MWRTHVLPWLQGTCVTHKILVYNLAHLKSPIAQWLVQSVFERAWDRLSLGALRNYIFWGDLWTLLSLFISFHLIIMYYHWICFRIKNQAKRVTSTLLEGLPTGYSPSNPPPPHPPARIILLGCFNRFASTQYTSISEIKGGRAWERDCHLYFWMESGERYFKCSIRKILVCLANWS